MIVLNYFATVLSHFMILSPFSRSCQAFFYSSQSFYDFVNDSPDLVSHFAIVLIHF
jgi:hypothetical protein